jgi:hypothetical protein
MGEWKKEDNQRERVRRNNVVIKNIYLSLSRSRCFHSTVILKAISKCLTYRIFFYGI